VNHFTNQNNAAENIYFSSPAAKNSIKYVMKLLMYKTDISWANGWFTNCCFTPVFEKCDSWDLGSHGALPKPPRIAVQPRTHALQTYF
jgi:hypothetical protein